MYLNIKPFPTKSGSVKFAKQNLKAYEDSLAKN